MKKLTILFFLFGQLFIVPMVLAEKMIAVERIKMTMPIRVTTELPPNADSGKEKSVQSAIERGFATFDELAGILSEYVPDNDIDRINKNAGKAPVVVDPVVVELVDRSRSIAEMTGGAFDISYFPLGKIWDFTVIKHLPEQQRIIETRKLVDYRSIRSNGTDHTVYLPKKGMAISLGGIAKGYIIERMVKTIMSSGSCSNLMVEIGGDITMVGKKKSGPWRIGIKHPRSPNELIGIVVLHDISIVTSGDYARFSMIDGKRIHHIIDPRSGNPTIGCQSVTLIHRDITFIDGLATGIFVLGPKAGMTLIDSIDGLEGMIVDNGGKIFKSKGMNRYLSE